MVTPSPSQPRESLHSHCHELSARGAARHRASPVASISVELASQVKPPRQRKPARDPQPQPEGCARRPRPAQLLQRDVAGSKVTVTKKE